MGTAAKIPTVAIIRCLEPSVE